MEKELTYDAFISYRHIEPDRSFAYQLCARLESSGFNIAIDQRDFQAEESFVKEMERCIKESRFTISVITSQYLKSGNTEEEAIICKTLDLNERKRRLIPLWVEKVECPIWLYGIVGINFIDENPIYDPFIKLNQTLRKLQPNSQRNDSEGNNLNQQDERTRNISKDIKIGVAQGVGLAAAGIAIEKVVKSSSSKTADKSEDSLLDNITDWL